MVPSDECVNVAVEDMVSRLNLHERLQPYVKGAARSLVWALIDSWEACHR